MEKITGIIITLNEEDHIEECIQSLKKVCDEIIVVDSFSVDATVKIARENGARIYEQSFLGDGPQKAFGVPYAKNDWIFSLDADERLGQELVDEIQKLNLTDPETAYAFKRKSYVGDHWIKAAGFYPDYVTRLYNRTTSGYILRQSHSKVEAPRIKKIAADIIHDTYRDYFHWLDRVNWLSSGDAWAYYQEGKKVNRFRPIISAFGAFIRKLILKGGIFQGRDGVTVALTTVMHTYMKYTKLLELYEKEKHCEK